MSLRELFRRGDQGAVDDEGLRHARRTSKGGSCPRCGAAADKRVDSCGFGPDRQELCGVCAYEFPKERR